MVQILVCWNCGESLEGIALPISRHANCAACFEMLRCCRMCLHYESDKRPYCDHERADPPVVKETANFCDYFAPTNRFITKGSNKAAKAKGELDSLFGAEIEPEEVLSEERGEGDRANKLDDLFDD